MKFRGLVSHAYKYKQYCGAVAAFTNSRNQALNSLDRGIDNVLTVRASLGTRLGELEALQNTGESISDLTQQKISLEAAQKSFLAVSELSLFTICSDSYVSS